MKKLLFAGAAALLLVAPPAAYGRHDLGPTHRAPHIVIHPRFAPPNFTPPGPPRPPDLLLGSGPRRHFYVFVSFVGHYVWCDDPRYWDSWWWWTMCR
jgi:hypothetical protein